MDCFPTTLYYEYICLSIINFFFFLLVQKKKKQKIQGSYMSIDIYYMSCFIHYNKNFYL